MNKMLKTETLCEFRMTTRKERAPQIDQETGHQWTPKYDFGFGIKFLKKKC